MELTGVGRRYGLRGPWILRDVGLRVPRGALLRIEGANGSGKSTLLRLLAGIDAPSAGRITGRPRTAYVPERFPAALPLTAVDYLTRLGRVHGLRRPDAARAALEWLERFGAAGHARTPLSRLSKGTSQKVAVAQGLVGRPELLVLDEAWTGLDRASREVLDRAVLDRVADGASVVFVDHDPRRLAGDCHAVHRVAAGRLLSAVTAEPRVRIEAEGPATLPERLPGDPVREPLGGVVRLTVAAADSDALLRALLTARPSWHIRSVTAADVPEEPRR
ncbi:ATP-binding cassette domain-containing protein [Streptomyces sp. AV19]|uniref:ATP-binding cassette domain-containing protein n=1 Tax=Streptomyces sp. AV19 TaxID=2793068 RepID=UPI0024135514|nr:ATP-binding cassette domain-containing protein [Streptomyces sp. AV19]MDG4535103.1 ATP-binding cassette domain-containing protein [Streptomyces sp. AV19]